MLYAHLREPAQLLAPVPRWLVRWGFGLNIVILITGLLTVALDASPIDYDQMEDAFEWVLTLMLQCNFLLSYFAWRSQALSAEFLVTMSQGK